MDGVERRKCQRREDYCPMHGERGVDLTEIKNTLFNDIKPRVYNQDGKLTILLWGIGVFCVFALGLGVTMAIYSAKMDKTFSAYIATHTVEASRWIELIKENREAVGKNSDRIDEIEKKVYR